MSKKEVDCERKIYKLRKNKENKGREIGRERVRAREGK